MITRAYDWLTKAVGLDDRGHHGISFTKVIILLFTLCVCRLLEKATLADLPWTLVILVLALLAAAFGRSEFRAVIDLLKAKWSGTDARNTNTEIKADLAEMTKAVVARRDSDAAAEATE